jgi:multicomponent Na+:H+ antiporter subunit A
MTLTISIAGYFVIAALVWAFGDRLGRGNTVLASLPYGLQLVVVGMLWTSRTDADVQVIDWIPSLGVAIGIRIDTLTLLLTTVVAGIGLLIVVYTDRYFADHARRGRFLALMSVFTAGMAGIVASDEIFGLFFFWEVTTVASYLLIGFDDELAAARSAALQAVLVTTAGGLAMLAGFVILATEAGTTSIAALVEAPPTGTAVTIALCLVFLGAFTKSAQFPFHFWLPGALAAPTPASAYLHSATMVKAGIVLLLFLAPGFADTSLWLWTVTGTGLVTMVVGAVAALRQHDLKLLLAYGTVSQLGFMTALIGLGYTAAALAVLVAHSLFKAALFLVTGVVDKVSGTRDVHTLTGVGSRYRLLGAVGAIAAASMAGVPPLLGFVTKEAAFDSLIADGAWVALATIAAASVLTVTYAAQWWFGAFGAKPGAEPLDLRPAYPLMVAPPAALAAATVLLGLSPGRLGAILSDAAGQSFKLILWPGFKPALALSTIVLLAGIAVFMAIRSQGIDALPTAAQLRLPTGAGLYQSSLRGLNATADLVTGVVQTGSLPIYLAIIITSVLFLPAVTWALAGSAPLTLPVLNSPAEVVLGGVAMAGAIAATRAQRRMAAALLLGVVGYALAGIFVVFSAPDLAMTQLLIETLTVALFALVLVKLPRFFGRDTGSLPQATRVAVAGFAGLVVTAGALITTTVRPDRSLTRIYVEEAPGAGGNNVVNIILTNFRALDTLGEITVLAAAGIGISALVLSVAKRRGEGRS